MATTPLLTDDEITKHLDAVLHASGSALIHYSMQLSIDRMSKAVRDIESAVLARVESRIAAMAEENRELTDVLHRNGFVRCDIAACNCGSWHARFGWPERFREFTEALEEAGANLHAGKTALTILKEMLAERDAAVKDAGRYRWLCGNNFDRQCTQIQTWVHSWEPHSRTGEPTEWKYRQCGALDTVIDNAMTAFAALSPTTDGGGTTAEGAADHA